MAEGMTFGGASIGQIADVRAGAYDLERVTGLLREKRAAEAASLAVAAVEAEAPVAETQQVVVLDHADRFYRASEATIA